MGKKLDLSDKKSAFASSFNAATQLTAAFGWTGEDQKPEDIADAVVDLTVALYEARIAATKELKLGGAEGKSTGGSGGQSGRSGGSKKNSGQYNSPGSPTDGQTSYYEDIAERIAADGGKLKPGVEKFKKLSYAVAKTALEDAIKIDPGK